ncbi:nucleotidyltransferase family protein [Parachryseolinea silvisoli]|uniref:hypothetical protein n=1 Tax=Parachryseolinea silvisoli TaxID=2873601 RepID=UPI002265A488|nr:hypothetical protein [Parachryseolinea silvisoli]MCD9014436.1 hypothetical protein [Parachryseolinea silvisoli]
MATTAKGAFDTFMKDFVRLDADRTEVAKKSKNNLVKEIEKFPEDGKFFLMYPAFSSIDYGSFSRKTKIRELDDIDIMIVMHAQSNWRETITGGYRIRLPEGETRQRDQCNPGTNVLNSIKVVNRFKEYLSNVPLYDSAVVKRNQEAATLKLKSYEWVFDIVPCFITIPDAGGDTFFLIPDGTGNWKPTDPRIDKDRTTSINGKQKISVLDMIRIMKYWTNRATMPTMESYFLENLILEYYDAPGRTSTDFIDEELGDLFALVYHKVQQPFYDPKGYQGDINHLTPDERNLVQERARLDYHRAREARDHEGKGRKRESIAKWGEIFGPDFPSFTV